MKIPIRKAMLTSLRIMSPAIGPSSFRAIQTGFAEHPFPPSPLVAAVCFGAAGTATSRLVRGPAAVRWPGAALAGHPAALPFGYAAPDPVADVPPQGVVAAFGNDIAAGTHRFRFLVRAAAFPREEHVDGDADAGGLCHPVGGFEFPAERFDDAEPAAHRMTSIRAPPWPSACRSAGAQATNVWPQVWQR